MYQAFLKFSALNEFLRGSSVLAVIFLLSFGIHSYLDGVEISTAGVNISTTEVTIERIHAYKKSFDFMGRESAGGALLRFNVNPIFTYHMKILKSKKGERITVNHFAGIVSSCFINGVQFCFPKCTSSYDCEVRRLANDSIAFKWISFTSLFLSLLCLFICLIKSRSKP